MRKVIAVLAMLLLAGSASAGRLDDGWPPDNTRGDAVAAGPIYFVSDVDPLCGKAPKGYHTVACVIDRKVVVLPNPCQPQYASQSYAKTACHELGHINGWPGDHPRPWP